MNKLKFALKAALVVHKVKKTAKSTARGAKAAAGGVKAKVARQK